VLPEIIDPDHEIFRDLYVTGDECFVAKYRCSEFVKLFGFLLSPHILGGGGGRVNLCIILG
jgi:hypothetical protein